MLFFTSDSHIGHARILELGAGRPFQSLHHMHTTLLERAWSVMTNEDTLFHLGDAAMGNFEESIKILAEYPGKKKFLIPGNHDRVFPKLNTASRIERFRPMYEDAGYEVLGIHEEISLEILGKETPVLLSHVPYTPERFEGRADKLAFARPEDKGLWLIHGHTHSSSKTSEHPREIQVGVDANDWTPVSEKQIVEHIESTMLEEGRV